MGETLETGINHSESDSRQDIAGDKFDPSIKMMLAEQIAAIEARTRPGASYVGKLEAGKELQITTEATTGAPAGVGADIANDIMSGETIGPLSKRLETHPRICLGIRDLDQALDAQNGLGIVAAGLHEIYSPTTLSFASAFGFALVLGNLIARQNACKSDTSLVDADGFEGQFKLAGGPVFWIGERVCLSEGGGLYGPGFHALGIASERIVHVQVNNLEEAIWAAGEVARSTKCAFGFLEVRGNPHKLDLATTRRLLLRCQRSNSSLFILRQAGEAQASATNTRWRVAPWHSDKNQQKDNHSNFEPADFGWKTRWQVALEKCRGGRPGQWILEWNHHEQTLQSVPDTKESGIRKTRNSQSEINSFALSGAQPAAIGKRPDRTQKMGDVVAFERAS